MSYAQLIGFGVAAVDDTFVVDGYPEADTKMRYLRKSRFGGGQTATALVAASRLGCSCRWGGMLGENELSAFYRDVFRREGVAFNETVVASEAEPVHSVIISDARTGSRTIMWGEDKLLAPQLGKEEFDWIDHAECLFVDQILPEMQLIAARRAAKSGVAIVADIERVDYEPLKDMVELSGHFIFPASMAGPVFGESEPGAVLAKALKAGRKELVCMTDGCRGAWFAVAENPDAVFHQPAFVVEPIVDSNGCGDVFHGAYAACLVKGVSPRDRIRFASAAAALKLRRNGGQTGAPTWRELEEFLAGGPPTFA